jgi:serine phosphatase RsbU (regulator of sigma subunit)
MNLLNNIFKVSSIHPLLKVNFKIRFAYCIVVIIPFISIAYERNLGAIIYVFFLLQTLTWPFIAYFVASRSKNQKKIELYLNFNIEMILYSFWLPITFFSPLYILLLLIALGTGGLTAGGFRLLITRLFSAIFGGILGGIIFGFRYNGEATLPAIFSTGVAAIFISWLTALFSYNTYRKMIVTRKILKEQKQKLEKELSDAADYVKTMLPPPITEGLVTVDWKYIPSAILGGDAFGYHWLDNNNFSFYLLDVSGHGVGAALLSSSILNVIRSQSLSDTNFYIPSQVFEKLNMTFQAEKHNDMFFTMWYGIFNQEKRLLTFSNAGHPPALMVTPLNSKTKCAVKLMNRNYIIGGLENIIYKQNSKFIASGSSIYIFSDGVYEIEKMDGSMMQLKEFQELIIEHLEKANNSLDSLYQYCLEMNGKDRYEDDYTILKITFA